MIMLNTVSHAGKGKRKSMGNKKITGLSLQVSFKNFCSMLTG